ncbi:glycosyltransferase [Peribacillus sp. B-H-3]|uniref:glycosyltransferase n=1 Tax=Peribacillus sp. B-H-3 TaxID=3400420 RepID=UPI003B015EC8
MESKKNISIYVRNEDITPSSYYRIIQYSKRFTGIVTVRNIAPKKLYKIHLNSNKSLKIIRLSIGSLYYMVMVVRVLYYLMIDYILKPKLVIVSKTFCPRYSPLILNFLLEKVAKHSQLIWDFDDYIFISGEISKKQADILEKNSKFIVVTSKFLKSKISLKYQSKVIILPTTDGDFQGFNESDLMEKRGSTFGHEIKLVWVATAGNIPNLLKVIDVLDKTAALLKERQNKELVLTVICNEPIKIEVQHLTIKNIEWTRRRAMEEIFAAHIGIMPLILNDYSLGKGGFKLVQYISTGLPVVASKVGFNEEVVDENNGILVDDQETNDDWVNAILNLSHSYDEWEKYSYAAYNKWKKCFSYDENLKVWREIVSLG